MVRIIEDLQREHRQMAMLLDVLESQVDVFRDAGTPDYELMQSIMEYTLHYPNLCHHPKEDLVVSRLLVAAPGIRQAVSAVLEEHAVINELSRRFAAALHNVATDIELPRRWFEQIAHEYIAVSRSHMIKEECEVFPMATLILTEQDWDELEADLQDTDDPLFGGPLREGYRRLYETIMAMAAEGDPAGLTMRE